MIDDAVPNARDAKLIDWLEEAHDNEVRLEADLGTQIPLIEKPAYQKRVEAHLRETKEHERLVAKRIGQLGGQAREPAGPAGLLAAREAVSAVGGAAGRAMAAVKGQIAARALAGEGVESQLRIAEDQMLQEHLEIAIYTRIEAFAEAVGDAETAKLSRAILRDEERMAKFLASELPKLVRALVRTEVPRDQRVTRSRPTRRAATAPRAASRPPSTRRPTGSGRSSKSA